MDRIDGPDQIAVDGDCLCHADLHPGNVLLGRGGPVVIDWTGVTKGDAMADVAWTRLLLRTGWPRASRPTSPG